MAQGGYILLNRSIQNHWLWEDEPFDKKSAWIDLLLLANYEDKKTSYKGEIIVCKRGDVNLSISYLAKRWKWNRRTVKNFLMLLESDGMCTTKCTTHRTVITIVNYDVYQLPPSTKCTTKCTTKYQQGAQQGNTTNKVNKNKKINKFNEMIHTDYDMEEIERTLNET